MLVAPVALVAVAILALAVEASLVAAATAVDVMAAAFQEEV